jgi:signal transduction histidine kinase
MSHTTPVDEALVDYLDGVDIPAIRINPDGSDYLIDQVNTAFYSEFNVDMADLSGKRLTCLTSDNHSPIQQLPRTPSTELPDVEIDIVTIADDQSPYLRNRVWQSECLLDFYVSAANNLPHHRHIDVLHRVFRHNLRNGINAIVGWAKVARDGDVDNQATIEALDAVLERAHELERISEEARQLEKLLYTNTELRQLNLQPVVSCAVTEVVDDFDNPNISVDIPPTVSVIANDKLQVAIKNLVDNAVRHNPTGTEVAITADRVSESSVELCITDSGNGLPQIEKQIFSGPCSLNKLEHGSGLGLWLVRWILEAHMADVDVDTVNREGTQFCITLRV